MTTATKNKFSRFEGVIKSTANKETSSAIAYQTQLNRIDRELQAINGQLHDLNKDPFSATLSESSCKLIAELTSKRSKLVARRKELVESYVTKA